MQSEGSTPSAMGPPVAGEPAKQPAEITLQGRYATVRRLRRSTDTVSLFEGTHDGKAEDFWRYMSAGPFESVDHFGSYLAKLEQSSDPFSFVIADPSSDRALGHASYMRITPEHRVIEIGNIFFTHWLARTRAATEAMYLMARHAFEDLGYRRYEWKCNSLNLASRRAAVRLGFTFEGTFKQHMIQKGRSRDTAWFSMLDVDWPQYKAAYEKWLLPDNFDRDGKAQSPLGIYLLPARAW